jgi:hypothetical protein
MFVVSEKKKNQESELRIRKQLEVKANPKRKERACDISMQLGGS